LDVEAMIAWSRLERNRIDVPIVSFLRIQPMLPTFQYPEQESGRDIGTFLGGKNGLNTLL
jgi:hypothetical protein